MNLKKRQQDLNLSNDFNETFPFQILMYSSKEYDRIFFEKKRKELKQPELYEIHYTHERLSKETIDFAIGYRCICIFVNDDASQEILDKLKHIGIQLIVLRCAGYNNIDLQAAQELKIAVGYVPGYSPNAIAEHAVTLAMSLNRHIHRAYNRVRDGDFRLDGLVGFDMNGKTVGVLGTGRIGQFTIRIFRGFGCHVLAFDAFPLKDEDRLMLGFEYAELDEIYARADIISIHLPLDKKTNYLINHQSIEKMKRGVLIINTARGALIDTKALLSGLKSGRIGGVGLDVYENEHHYFFNDCSSKIIDDDHLIQLMSYPNVLITSHQAFLTREALCSIAKATFENVHSFLATSKTLYCPKF